MNAKMKLKKRRLLQEPIRHIDMKTLDVVPMIDAMGGMAIQARNLSRACGIYDRMLRDKECTIILCLAGSLVSAGLKKVIADMVTLRMVDVIVSTGANLVDQDYFEALGFKHYIGTPFVDDNEMRDLHIDRIYDTFIDEDNLRYCDETIARIADSLQPRPYSSREFFVEMGRYLEHKRFKAEDSIVAAAYRAGVPLFAPAFSDCSAGFGLVEHQVRRPEDHVTIDSVRDFRELTKIKLDSKQTGIVMIGGGVPKNFTQDIVVAAEVLGFDAPMHKYAVQITVADERDGALSGSTLREASSWGKVSTSFEQMVYGEATVFLPILAAYGYRKKAWKTRKPKRFKF